MITSSIALILSLLANIMLMVLAYKMRGGRLSTVLILIVLGVFFAITVHSGVELAEHFNLIGSTLLLPMMGALLSIGSVLLIIAGYLGLRIQA